MTNQAGMHILAQVFLQACVLIPVRYVPRSRYLSRRAWVSSAFTRYDQKVSKALAPISTLPRQLYTKVLVVPNPRQHLTRSSDFMLALLVGVSVGNPCDFHLHFPDNEVEHFFIIDPLVTLFCEMPIHGACSFFLSGYLLFSH